MSGGHFDYSQYRIQEIADSAERYLKGRELDDDEVQDILNDRWTDEDEKQYVKEHKHSVPNRYGYSDETIAEFKKGIKILRKAYIYAQRMDLLLSCDDGEDSFHSRLKEELAEIDIE